MGLENIFDATLLPLAQEAGACLFKIMLISGIYIMIRGSASDSIKKIKTATIGYFLLKLIQSYIKLIDVIAGNINF